MDPRDIHTGSVYRVKQELHAINRKRYVLGIGFEDERRRNVLGEEHREAWTHSGPFTGNRPAERVKASVCPSRFRVYWVAVTWRLPATVPSHVRIVHRCERRFLCAAGAPRRSTLSQFASEAAEEVQIV